MDIGGCVHANGSDVAARIVVDGVTTRMLSGERPSAGYVNVLSGASRQRFAELSAAQHTVQLQVRSKTNGSSVYFDPVNEADLYSLSTLITT